ncbi:MAG: ORF6N domain-containing protein [Fibromonadaceae bacterium]|nr:ORF6N domain-containing protein [Fibromonadaceae bacterium]
MSLLSLRAWQLGDLCEKELRVKPVGGSLRVFLYPLVVFSSLVYCILMAKELAQIQNMIHETRGQKVMLDSDLAALYGVELRSLNQAVKRNIDRFPPDFMFQLTEEEWKNQRSQFVIFNKDTRKYKPYAFTEHGILMLSSVLNSSKAIGINIQIMRVFVKMRHYVIPQSKKNAQVTELRKLLMLHIESSDRKFSEHDKTIRQIVHALNNLIEQPPKTKKIGFCTD